MSESDDKPPVKLVVPENALKKKVGHGGFDPGTLQRAQTMLENNTVDFRPVALQLSDEIDTVLSKIRSTTFTDPEHMGALMYPVMQLRAQGGLFHYPLITKVSHIIIDFLENISSLDTIVVDIADGYRKAIKAIVSMQIKDEHSKNALALCEALDGVCNRYYKRKNMI